MGVIEREVFKPGQIIRHFKRDFLSEEEKKTNKYLYKVIGTSMHTENLELLLVYEALYPPFTMYCRPLTMALGFVDKEKYPDAKQQFRLELYDLQEDYHGRLQRPVTNV